MSVKSSETLVKEALKIVKTREPHEVKELCEQNQCILIDIRDIRELMNEGSIEGSIHIPRGMLEFWLDPKSDYYKKNIIDHKKEFVLFCGAGFRSALATKSLMDMGYLDVSHINGGFNLMKKSGFQVTKISS